jgi:hypothetical protein
VAVVTLPPAVCPDLITSPFFGESETQLERLFMGPNVFGAYARAKFSGGWVVLRTGTGGGLSTPPNGFFAELGDFDLDGEVDLLMSTPYSVPDASIMYGPWSATWSSSTFEGSFDQVYCGDINGDGLDDRCGTRGVDQGPVDGVLDVTFDVGRHGSWTVDFGQGPQLVISDGEGLSLVPPLPSSPPVVPPAREDHVLPEEMQRLELSGVHSVEVVDLDQDGTEELLVFPGGHIVDDAVFAGAPLSDWSGSTTWGTVGDFNGDGVLEHLINEEGRLEVRAVDGTVLQRIPNVGGFGSFGPAVVGDPNGDGIDSILVSDFGDGGHIWHFTNLLCPEA